MEKYSDEKFRKFVDALEKTRQTARLESSNINFPKMTESEKESLRRYLDTLSEISQNDQLTREEKARRLTKAIHGSNTKEEDEEEEK